MTDAPNGNGKDDQFLADMETAIRSIIKAKKASKADKLSAINAGLKLTAIRHKIFGGDDKTGFFDK